jgi:hypothetical protein
LNATGYTPSAITQINGQNVDDFLLGASFSLQDKDATYNAALLNPATALSHQGGSFQDNWALFDFSDTTTYTFANGTTSTLSNLIKAGIDFSDITSGQDLYQKYVVDPPESSQQKRSIQKRAPVPHTVPPVTATATGSSIPSIPTTSATSTQTMNTQASIMSTYHYPSPVALSNDGAIGGYFLNDEAGTAVLQITGFVLDETNHTASLDFQSSVTKFLNACRSSGKKKLLIDVRGNPGGLTATAYDTFKQLFPTSDLYTKIRMRAHPLFNAIGSVISNVPVIGDADIKYWETHKLTSAQEELYDASTSIFDPGSSLNANGDPFSSWSSFYGPQNINGDQFTNYFSVDYENYDWDILSGFIPYGFGNRTNIPPQPFQGSDVTLVTDGACSSSCGILSNLLIREGNISTLTFGGRPSTDPMAIIGGVQGAQVRKLSEIYYDADIAGYLLSNGYVDPLPEGDESNTFQEFQQFPKVIDDQFSFNWMDNMEADSGKISLTLEWTCV